MNGTPTRRASNSGRPSIMREWAPAILATFFTADLKDGRRGHDPSRRRTLRP
jgi:hypothetical protein